MSLTRRRINDLAFLALLAVAAGVLFLAMQWSRDATDEPAGGPVNLNSVVGDLPSLDVPRSSQIDQGIAALQARVSQNENDQPALARLGLAYLQKARDTADPTYYVKAEQALTKANSLDAKDYIPMVGLGSLALARHDFKGALAWGEKAAALNPDSPAVFGVIGDAQTELGNYDAAVDAVQTMVDLRPDLSSYARVSYQRELHGDREGALEAMQQAVTAGSGVPENEAWARVELGNLHFGDGELDEAGKEYQRALDRLPDYPRALGGLGRVAGARGDYAAAILYYRQATERVPLPELVIALGDTYQAAGRLDDARKQFALVGAIQQLLAVNGVNTDLELALFDLDHDRDLAGALDGATRSYESRKSIGGADVLAWAYYRNGRCGEAAPLAKEAIRLGTRDGLILFHAGMIAQCNGERATAIDLLQRALAANPHFSLRYGPAAAATLASLKVAQS